MEPLLWDTSFNLRAGLGYKDNVLLGPANPQQSGFAATGFDLMVLRLPIDGPQFYLFLSGDDLRYWREVNVDKEQTFVAVSKLQKEFGKSWEAGLAVQYIYQNQVFDVSATETDLATIQLKGHAIKLAPSLTRRLSENYRLQLETPVSRQYLLEPLDDYWEGGPKLTLERHYARKSVFSLSYAFERRIYDDRAQTDDLGFSWPGTSLQFQAHEFELVQRHHWDEKRRWRSDTKLAFELNLDNGSGFFDYHRYQVSEQLRFASGAWMLRGNVRVNFYDYALQTAEAGSSSKRKLTTLSLALRGERNLTKKLKLFAELEHEQNLSNRSSNEYRANTVMAGLDWEL